MNKVKINMVGGGFQHDVCSSAGNTPEHIEWDKGGGGNISIHIDNGITQIPVNKSKKNYAWFAESSSIIPHIINWLPRNLQYLEDNFELMFTHDHRLLSLSEKFRPIICNAVPWIKNYKIHEKSKLVSMIASTKLMCEGHRYRQTVVAKYEKYVDCFGTGRKCVENKEDALKDYYFSIGMENDNYPNIFTEKITDCFVSGTLPIFWGTPLIGEHFNEDGVITLTDDLKMEDLTPDLYHSKMEAIKDNFERAVNLPTAEDYIYEKYIK